MAEEAFIRFFRLSLCKTPDRPNTIVVVLVVVVLGAVAEPLIPRVVIIVLRRRPKTPATGRAFPALIPRLPKRRRELYSDTGLQKQKYRQPLRFCTKTMPAPAHRGAQDSGCSDAGGIPPSRNLLSNAVHADSKLRLALEAHDVQVRAQTDFQLEHLKVIKEAFQI